MLTIKEAKEKLSEKEYRLFKYYYEFSLKEEHLSKERLETRNIMQEILKRNGLEDDDPYDILI